MKEIISKYKDYLLADNKSQSTIRNYTRTINQLLNRTKKKTKNITREDIRKFQVWCREEKQYETNSLINKYAAVNLFIEFLDTEGLNNNLRDQNNQLMKLKIPKKTIKNKVPLTAEEVKQLFKVASEDKRNQAIIKTLYYSMARNGEIQSLNIEDVDFQRNKLRINKAKGNKPREINLPQECLTAIKEYLNDRSQLIQMKKHCS